MASNVILETRNLSKYFGGIRALHEVSITIARGSITGIIGPNGAGKSTLFKTIAGFYKPTSGKVIFEGTEIQGKPPHKIALMGIALTFQVPRQLYDLTVFENVAAALGRHNYTGLSFLGKWGRRDIVSRAYEIIRIVGLEDYMDRPARILPLGMQKRLEVARALALEPKILMLDEPAAGMSIEEIEELKELIRSLNKRGLTILLVEHNVPFAIELSEYMYVLHYGVLLAHGKPDEVVRDKRVIEAYLGAGYARG